MPFTESVDESLVVGMAAVIGDCRFGFGMHRSPCWLDCPTDEQAVTLACS